MLAPEWAACDGIGKKSGTQIVTEFLFWLSAGVLVYTYAGYPLLIGALAWMRGRTTRKAELFPSISIIIPAYDEEAQIAGTVANKLMLDYPKEKMEIIVVSDGSTDETDRIVEKFSSQGVRLIRQDPRQGKTCALNKGIAAATGGIVVFADANSLYGRDALRYLMSHFADANVGYVTGRMAYVHPDGSGIGHGCSTYMYYEDIIRKAETSAGSLVGVNGGIDAIRKSLYVLMQADDQPDFVLPLRVIERGYRVVFEPRAILHENALERPGDEYKMRVRVALRALNTIRQMKHLLNPFRYGIFAWQLFSHKVLRYAAFLLLLASLAANVSLLGQGMVYDLSLAAQGSFYVCAACGWFFESKGRKTRLTSIPFYFCLGNVACAHAFVKMLLGERQAIWTPRLG